MKQARASHPQLLAVRLALGAALFGTLTVAGPALAQACGPEWALSPADLPAGRSLLLGVDGLSADDAWAVGSAGPATGAEDTLAVQWDGDTWTTVPTPDLGSESNVLQAVSGTASSDVWAVGRAGSEGAPGEPLILHWDGSDWTLVPAPTVGTPDAPDVGLLDVFARTANDAWAVGTSAPSGANQALSYVDAVILRWDGAAWRVVPTPTLPAAATLESVFATAADDAWAVGSIGADAVRRALILHWDGSSWSEADASAVAGARSFLLDVTAVSPTDAWAMGGIEEAGVSQPLALDWDGVRWNATPSVAVPGRQAEFQAFAALDSDRGWAVGLRGTDANTFDRLAVRRNGVRWFPVAFETSVTAEAGNLYDVSAAGGNVWAVEVTDSGTTPAGRILRGCYDVPSERRSGFASSLVTPGDLSVTPEHVATNLGVTILLVLLIPFPSTLFNRTLRDHHDVMTQRFRGLRGVSGRLMPDDPGPVRRYVTIGVLILLVAVLYALLDPGFGFNFASISLYLGIALGLAVVIVGFDVAEIVYMRRRHEERADFRGYPIGIVIALVCVAVSRLADFQPGYLLGVIAGFGWRRQLTGIEEGKKAALAAGWTLALALLAWVVRTPIAEAAGRPGASLATLVLDATLVAVVVAGIEGVMFGLLPVRSLDGGKVRAWSTRWWLVLFGLATFAFVYILINPKGDYLGPGSTLPLAGALALVAGFTMFAVGFWWYFRNKTSTAH